MKGRIFAVVIVALILSAAAVCAEESVFDKASKCIAGWKAPSCMTSTCQKSAPAQAAVAAPACPTRKTDVLGNQVPCKTVK